MAIIIDKSECMKLPLIPLRGTVAFPGVPISMELTREASVKALEISNEFEGKIFLLSQADITMENPTEKDFCTVGTVCEIKQVNRAPGGAPKVLFECISRAEVKNIRSSDGVMYADIVVKTIQSITHDSDHVDVFVFEIRKILEKMKGLTPALTEEFMTATWTIGDPALLCDFIASSLLIKVEHKQEILECFDPVNRIEKLVFILSKEIDFLEFETELHKRVCEQIDENQKEYYMREQMKLLQNDLGESDDEIEEYYAALEKAKLPTEVEEKLRKEIARLSKTPYAAAESTVLRNYLDTCLELPWNITSADETSVKAAEKILDEDHSGMKKVKERILEYIAVKQFAPELKDQILCLVGPPGVGKTSIAISIARALGRKLARVSLGGVRDEADIRGHRKTYVGAMPGRIIEAISKAGVRNPLIVLDEVDKLSHNLQGDPASALLEVLDGEQNNRFRDHFLELPFDLSDCIFIATANEYDGIPAPLLDRMEVIELDTYSPTEKLKIAKEHLIPKELKKHGLTKKVLSISDDAVDEIIDGYTREAGVRNLDREIASVCRKAAKVLATSDRKRIIVKKSNVSDFLGKRKILPTAINDKNEIGVVNGLAYTMYGGDLLKIEATVMEGTGKLELTGSLGDVMKESAHIAQSYVRSIANKFDIDTNFYKNNDIHIHVPEGAVPKDGPSAGVTMMCALTSALSGLKVKRDVAMTGELTLRGNVLAIGGLKEKTLAAYAAGVKTVLIPKENEKDIEDLDPVVKENVKFILCDNAIDVLNNSLVTIPKIDYIADTPKESVDKANKFSIVNPKSELKIQDMQNV